MRTLNKKMMTLACATCLTVGMGAVACAGYGRFRLWYERRDSRNGVKASVIDSVSTNARLRTKNKINGKVAN